MEDPIAEEYMEITGRKVLRDNKIRIHPEHECLIVNLDRVIVDNGDGKGTGVLECKSTVSYVYKRWKDETDTQSIPLEYYCQIQHELSVTGYKWAILAVMVLDQRQCYFLPIERDEDYIQRQNKVLVAWWNAFVLNNVPPPMTAAEYSHSNVITGSKVDADRETEQIYFELKKQRLEKKKIDDEVKRLEDKIKTYLGENEILMIGDTIAAIWLSYLSYRRYSASKHYEGNFIFLVSLGVWLYFISAAIIFQIHPSMLAVYLNIAVSIISNIIWTKAVWNLRGRLLIR